MPRVQFLTNASTREGMFGVGAAATISDALRVELGNVVKVVEEAAVEAEQPSIMQGEPSPEGPVVEGPENVCPPAPDANDAGEQAAAPVVQISASDGAHADSHAG